MTKVTTSPTTYGYARVSGNTQDLSDQLAQLEAAGCSQVYREKITGTRADRPQFQAVLAQLDEGDTLVVTKLDRFARSAQDAISLVRDLMRRGVRIHILNMGVVENTTTGRLLLTILAGFAEFERDLIVERLAEGKAAARQRDDWREGRPRKYSRQQIEHAMALLGEYSYTEVERMTGISKATLVRRSRERKQKQAGVTP